MSLDVVMDDSIETKTVDNMSMSSESAKNATNKLMSSMFKYASRISIMRFLAGVSEKVDENIKNIVCAYVDSGESLKPDIIFPIINFIRIALDEKPVGFEYIEDLLFKDLSLKESDEIRFIAISPAVMLSTVVPDLGLNVLKKLIESNKITEEHLKDFLEAFTDAHQVNATWTYNAIGNKEENEIKGKFKNYVFVAPNKLFNFLSEYLSRDVMFSTTVLRTINSGFYFAYRDENYTYREFTAEYFIERYCSYDDSMFDEFLMILHCVKSKWYSSFEEFKTIVDKYFEVRKSELTSDEINKLIDVSQGCFNYIHILGGNGGFDKKELIVMNDYIKNKIGSHIKDKVIKSNYDGKKLFKYMIRKNNVYCNGSDGMYEFVSYHQKHMIADIIMTYPPDEVINSGVLDDYVSRTKLSEDEELNSELLSKDEKLNSSFKICTICLTNPTNIVFNSCKHSICLSCLIKLFRDNEYNSTLYYYCNACKQEKNKPEKPKKKDLCEIL